MGFEYFFTTLANKEFNIFGTTWGIWSISIVLGRQFPSASAQMIVYAMFYLFET